MTGKKLKSFSIRIPITFNIVNVKKYEDRGDGDSLWGFQIKIGNKLVDNFFGSKNRKLKTVADLKEHLKKKIPPNLDIPKYWLESMF